ncbi:hypothetical protein HMPREF9237_01000 [Actinotignum schaalii FB123-CNA-2]|uniref:Uncharacterized protein n=1 Tax=Actinotignum schaalii FB123-CNA-2 TaxID=883067 RepID=S2VHY8_9ACTO|nr:hypothetical protein HMPREF9237_01000 [Actinotignum schaalii FB123-CNA-2]
MSLTRILWEAMSRTRTVPSRAAWLTRGSGALHRTTALYHRDLSSRKNADPGPRIGRCLTPPSAPVRKVSQAVSVVSASHPAVRAGEEGVFFRDVLRMYDKRSTALKTDTPFPGTGVTIEACEALETLVGR